MDPTELFPWLVGGGTVLTIVVSTVCAVCVPLAIVGGVFYYIFKRGGQRSQLNKASLTWPSTTGTVLKSRVEVSGGEMTSVTPKVIYEYNVAGVRYEGDTIRAGDKFMRVTGSGTAYDTVDRYPEGAAVTVYYNPANPAQSALER